MDLFAVPVPGTRGASRGVAFAFSRDAQTLAGGLPAAGSALRWALQSCWMLCQAADELQAGMGCTTWLLLAMPASCTFLQFSENTSAELCVSEIARLLMCSLHL